MSSSWYKTVIKTIHLKFDKKPDMYIQGSLNIPPHKRIPKEKRLTSKGRSLADTTLFKWIKWTLSVMGQSKIMQWERIYATLMWYSWWQCIIWIKPQEMQINPEMCYKVTNVQRSESHWKSRKECGCPRLKDTWQPNSRWLRSFCKVWMGSRN